MKYNKAVSQWQRRPWLDDPAARGTVAALLRHPFWLDAAEKLERVLPRSYSISASIPPYNSPHNNKTG